MIIDSVEEKREAHQDARSSAQPSGSSSTTQTLEAPPSYYDARYLQFPHGNATSPSPYAPIPTPSVQQGGIPSQTPSAGNEYPSDTKINPERVRYPPEQDQSGGAGSPSHASTSQPSTPQTNSSGKKKANPTSQLLDPPPPSFHRAPPSILPYGPFPPLVLLSQFSQVNKGFPLLPPPATTNPHAFVSHDVNEEDWKRFLDDVTTAGGLSTTEKVVSQVAPIVMGLRFLPVVGLFVRKGMDLHTQSRKTGPVGDLIDHWNHYFFHPRQLEVTLAQGRVRLTGPDDGLPPDILYRKKHRTGRLSDDDYSSDSSSDGYGYGGSYGAGRGSGNAGMMGDSIWAAKRQRKMERRMARRQKRQDRQNLKDSWDEKVRLVVSHRPLRP